MRILPILLALGLAVGVPAAPSATPVDDGSVTLVAAPAFSGVLRPGQDLQVSGTVANSAAQALDAGIATVYLGHTGFATSAAVSDWLSSDPPGGGIPSGAALGSLKLGELAPGQVRPFTITIPAVSLPLTGTSMRILPLSVRLATGDVELDLVRSSVVWTPDEAAPRVELAIAMPIVAPPSATGLLDAGTLKELTAPGGLLDAQLSSALRNTVAIGIDPMILASIRLLGSTAPPSALSWLTRLEAAPNDVFSLAYADADLPLLRRARSLGPISPTSFPIDVGLFPDQPEETTGPGGTPQPSPGSSVPTPQSLVAVDATIPSLAWPADDTVTEGDLDFLAEAGFSRSLILSSELSGTSATSPNATVGSHSLTVVDATISKLLREAAKAAGDAAWNHAMASLSGILAASATDHSGAVTVAALGRDGSATGARLDSTLDALASLPWVSPTTLGPLLRLPAVKASLTPAEGDDDRIATARSLVDEESAVARFATVVDEPELVTGPQHLALLGLFAASWVNDPAGWNLASGAFLTNGERIRASVHIPDSSTITLLQEKGNLPITVRNELDFPVTVYVRVQPERAILDVLNDRVQLTIEAGSQAKASIPVQSIANGEVRTMVSLTSPTGVAISTPTFVVLNVQAGWETAATVVLAVIVVGLFAAGIWRTVLRRRKARAASRAKESTT